MQILHPQHTHALWGLRRAGEQQTAVQLPVSLVSVLQWAVLPQAVLVSFDYRGAEIIVLDICSAFRSKVTPAWSNLLLGLLQGNTTAEF